MTFFKQLSPITYTVILAQFITSGMYLVNIGIVSEVEIEQTAKLVRITCKDQFCLSAAFFWYRFDSKLTIASPIT